MAAFSSAVKSSLKKVTGLKQVVLVPQDLEDLSEEDIKAMTKLQLKEILRRLDLPRTGNRPDLLDGVLNHYRSKWDTVREENRGLDIRVNKDSGTDNEDLQGKVVKVSTATSGVEGSISRKMKKWRKTDPAQIAPNFYHRDLFTANFPLVKVVDVPEGYMFPVRDKFEAHVLDGKETFDARMQWLSRFLEVEHTYCKAETERQASPKHFAFLEGLWQFTKPSRKEVQRHNNICAMSYRKWSYDEISGRSKKRKLDEEDNVGFHIVPDTEEIDWPLGANRSNGDNEGSMLFPKEVAKLTGNLEEDVDNLEEDVDAATGFVDGVLHVVDERPLERAAPNSQVVINPDRVACLLERKFLEDTHKWNARFQGGFYAAKHCMVNISRGHGTPVYVLVMTSSSWSYGILIPKGYVQVRNGEVDINSMPEFERHQQITGTPLTSLVELRAQLKRGTEFYRKNFLDNPNAIYADNPMLVGNYYLSSEWFSLPRAEVGFGDVPDVRRLFDGLMRVILGDSALYLKAEDYKQRRKLRKQMLKEEAYSV